MGSVKKLAGQTLWYGIPSIISRFLGYLMNMALPLFIAQPSRTADITQAYAIIPFLNILFTYGLETAYFRFSPLKDRQKLYSTLTLSIIGSTILLTGILLLFRNQLADAASLTDNSIYVTWMAGIIFFDTLAALPFARLRQENRPRRYAFVRMGGIVVNIIVVIICMGILPKYLQNHPGSYLSLFFDDKVNLKYYLIGNFCGSVFTFLMLWKEFKQIEWKFDTALWKEVMKYSYPLIIVGMGGMINDMLSRLIYQHVVDLPPQQAKHELGIFGNIYRLAVLITIAIQAFRMAAEPFFFSKSQDADAKKTYARVMKFFVITCCFLFLGIGLFLDVFEWLITLFNKQWGEGISVVPLLAMGNIFLGIYYNLSVWYKLSNKNMTGAWITIAGAVITIVLNVLLIPHFHYWGAAIATFSCYAFMMISSYKLGQKHYRIPYAVKKLTAYLVIVTLLYLLHRGAIMLWDNWFFKLGLAALFFALFAKFISITERKELQRLPVVGKWIK